LRFQKPQRGRNREFWQLNFDVFGSNSINADTEIIQMALEIMLAFNPPQDSFVVYINNRKLIDTILDQIVQVKDAKKEVVRILDKWDKLTTQEFTDRLLEVQLNPTQATALVNFMNAKTATDLLQFFPELETNEGFQEIQILVNNLTAQGYGQWISFQPNIIRGFDYYDGMVFEVFDKFPGNNRSMFGGGRYNGLASLFGSQSFPAVGSAPGDETIYLFLESWSLIPPIEEKLTAKSMFIPLLNEESLDQISSLASQLRNSGYAVETGLEPMSIGKALQYADKTQTNYILLLGSNEIQDNTISIKEMDTGKQVTLSRNDLDLYLSNL